MGSDITLHFSIYICSSGMSMGDGKLRIFLCHHLELELAVLFFWLYSYVHSCLFDQNLTLLTQV